MYHMHVGLSTWAATEAALVEVHAGLAAHGSRRRPVRARARPGDGRARGRAPPHGERDRPAHRARRVAAARRGSTHPAAPRRPHDRLPGRASRTRCTRLSAGVTTIGNVGQYTAYDLLGGSDEILVTEETVRSPRRDRRAAATTARWPIRTSRTARRPRRRTSVRTSAGRRSSCTWSRI